MKLIVVETENEFSFEAEFKDEEVHEFIAELIKYPRVMKALYDDLVRSGRMTPHGEV